MSSSLIIWVENGGKAPVLRGRDRESLIYYDENVGLWYNRVGEGAVQSKRYILNGLSSHVDEIVSMKKIYLKHHPDKGGDEEAFNNINERSKSLGVITTGLHFYLEKILIPYKIFTETDDPSVFITEFESAMDILDVFTTLSFVEFLQVETVDIALERFCKTDYAHHFYEIFVNANCHNKATVNTLYNKFMEKKEFNKTWPVKNQLVMCLYNGCDFEQKFYPGVVVEDGDGINWLDERGYYPTDWYSYDVNLMDKSEVRPLSCYIFPIIIVEHSWTVCGKIIDMRKALRLSETQCNTIK